MHAPVELRGETRTTSKLHPWGGFGRDSIRDFQVAYHHTPADRQLVAAFWCFDAPCGAGQLNFGVIQKERAMSARTDWVDYAKAIGIVLVVYGHVARGLFNAGVKMPVNLYHLVDSIVHSFHMPLFFFLSGLFFYHSFLKRGGTGLILNKVDTIVYPYLIWSLLQGSVEVLLSEYTNRNIALSEVLALWNPRAQFWFLYALFFVFVISTAIHSFFSQKYAIFVFILASLLYITRTALPDIKIMTVVANNLVFFIFGIVFMKYNFSKRLSSKTAALITMIAFISSQYLFHGYLGKSYTDKGVESLLLACVSVVFVVSLSMVLSTKPNRFIVFLGTSSLAIYLMHILAGSGARIILSKFLGIDAMAIHLIIGCFAGVLLPLLAFKIINVLKIPYMFSAPISKRLEFLYNKTLQRISR